MTNLHRILKSQIQLKVGDTIKYHFPGTSNIITFKITKVIDKDTYEVKLVRALPILTSGG